MVKIKKSTLESICEAARNTYPDEFIALIGSKRYGVIDDLVVLPATFGENFSSIRIDLAPFDDSIVGSVHSHPGKSARPSGADLRVFKRTGKTHLIIAHPFSLENARAFARNGEELELKVVE
jgi:proteasome lid subunit RPN8/RPN11